MTVRQKKGLGYIVTGLLFVIVGAVLWFATSTPPVVNLIVQAVGAIANVVGLAILLPEVT